MKLSFSVINKNAVAYATAHAAESVGRKLINGVLKDDSDEKLAITEDIRNALRNIIVKALASEKMSIRTVEKEIINYTGFNKERAKEIAHTEIATALVKGNMISYRASGVVFGKKWLLGMTPCHVCEMNAAVGIILLDEPFPSGHDAPPAHAGCCCDVAPITDAKRIGCKS